MTLLVHYSDFAEFAHALDLCRASITKEKLFATTRWIRGMPETAVVVDCSFCTFDELHRFSVHVGNIFHEGSESESIMGIVDKHHAQIKALADHHRLKLIPGRAQLWAEVMGKGGAK